MAVTAPEAPPRDEEPQPGEPLSGPPLLPPWMPVERLVTILVLVGSVAYIFWQLHPSLILKSTTPAGGDMGAHVWAPAYLREHLVPSLRLTGWTQDWYAGFPAFHFYMVLPSLAIVVLDVLLPYGVAFKLVSIVGLLALPVALYLFGRLAGMAFPGPQLLGVVAVPFLFDRSFTIYGGNIPSTLAGEFAFSISLAFAIVFLGVVLRGLETGRNRALAAVLFGLTALCHLIPAIFAIVGALVAWALRPGRRRAWWVVSSGAVGGLLTAWWALPFWWRRPYLTDMGWEKLTTYWENLFPGDIGRLVSEHVAGGAGNNNGQSALPGDLTWVIVFAVVGFAVSLATRRRPGIFLGVLAIVMAVAFRVAPQGRLWNARLLPFFYLCLFMLFAIAVLEIAHAISVLIAKDVHRPIRSVLLAAPPVLLVVVLGVVGMALRANPFGSTSVDGTSYSWLGITTKDRSYIPDWSRWNYSGYEEKAAYPEFRQLVETMDDIGRRRGCGRALWEYESALDRFGTPMALMLLPYHTDECIGSMEGLYFEASATTPYHFLMQSELSASPSRAQRDLQYRDLDLDLGVDHLQLVGVRYYMAFSERAVSAAAAHDDLTELATVPGQNGTWHIYEVADAAMVQSVEAEPVVVTDVAKGGRDWQDMAEQWFNDPAQWDVLRAASGPDEWDRVRRTEQPRARDVDPVEVRNVEQGTSTISFDVSDVGTPVLVKTSYFPNWEVSGADGPYRVAPNFMVVVPTSEHVELRYGRTPVEWFSWLLTIVGVVLVVLLSRRPPLAVPPPSDRRWRLRVERVDEPTADTVEEIELEDQR